MSDPDASDVNRVPDGGDQPAVDGNGEPDSRGEGPLGALDARLAALRADDRQRRLALALSAIVGIGLATVHWVGLVVAGALVGLTRRSVPRAVAAGLGVGVLVLGLFLVLTPVASIDALGTLRPLSYLTVGIALLGPAWGALLRGAL